MIDGDGRTLVARDGEIDYEWRVQKTAWSPDSRYLAVLRNDARAVHKIPIVNYSTALERVTMTPYVKSGTPLARPELHVVEPATGRVTRASLGDEEHYLWVAGWRPDGSEAHVRRFFVEKLGPPR